MVSYPVSFLCGILYYFDQVWIGNNIFGICIVLLVPSPLLPHL